MFTPSIQSIDRAQGRLRLIVVYSNGFEKIEEELVLTSPRNLKDILRNRSKELDDLSSFSKDISVGEVDITIEEVPEVLPEPLNLP